MTNSFGYGDLNTFGSFDMPVEYDFGGEINFKYNPVNGLQLTLESLRAKPAYKELDKSLVI